MRAPVATLFEALRARLAGGSKSRRPSEEVVLAVVQLAVEAVHSADRGLDAGREAYSVIRELVPHLSRDRVRRAASVLINGALRRTPPGGSGPLDVVRGLLVPALEAPDVSERAPPHLRRPCAPPADSLPFPQENTRKNALLLVADCAPSLVGGGRGPDAAAAAAAAPATATALSLILQGSVAGLSDASYAVIAAAQKAIARLRNVDAGFGDRLRALPPEAQACVDRNADGIRQAAALLAQVSSLLGGGGAAAAGVAVPALGAAPQGPLASPAVGAPLALAGLGVTGASVGPGRVGPALPVASSAPAAPPPPHHGTPVRGTPGGAGLGGAIRIPQGTPPPQPVGATSGLFIASSASAASGGAASGGTARQQQQQQWPPASSRSGIVGPSVPAVVSGPPAAFTNASTSTGSGSSVRALPFGTGFGAVPPQSAAAAAAAPAPASVTWAAAATVIAAPEAASSGPPRVDLTAPVPVTKAAPGHFGAAVLPAEGGGTPLVLPQSTERTSPRPGAGRRGGSPRPGAGAAGGIVVSPRHVPVGADVPLSPLESTARATMEAAAAAAAAYASGTASSASSSDAKHATPRTRTSSVVVQTGVPVVLAGGPLARAPGGSFFQAAQPAAVEGQPAMRRVPSSEDGFVIHQQQPGQQPQPGGITMHGNRSLSRIGSNFAHGHSPVVVTVAGGHEAAAAPPSDSAAAPPSSKPPLAPSSSALNLLASPRGTQSAAGSGNGATSRVVLEALAALSGSRAHAAVLAGMCGVSVHPSLVGAGDTPGAAAAPAPTADEGGGGGGAGSDAMSGMGGPSIETRAMAVAALAAGLASIDSAATLAARMAGSGASLAALPAVLGLAAAAASRDPSPRVAAVGLGSVPHAAQVMRLAVPLSAAYGPVSQLIQVCRSQCRARMPGVAHCHSLPPSHPMHRSPSRRGSET